MRAVAAISGHCRPLIIEHARSGLAGVHHRLDGQHHAIAQPRSVATSSKVRNLRFLVQLGSNAMSHKLTHYAETIGLNKFLYRGPNVPDGIADSRRLNAAIECLLRYFEQLAQLRRERSIDRNCDRRVTVIAIEDNAAIDGNNVSGLQRPLFRRNSVYDLFVDRNQASLALVVLGHRFGLKLVIGQALPYDFLAVIISDHQLGTIDIASVGDTGRLGVDVVDPSADGTGTASGKTA